MGTTSSRKTKDLGSRSQEDRQETVPLHAPNLPEDFWLQLEVQQACRERHFGHLLRSYRELQSPPLTQGELAQLLSLTQGQISRIERSVKPITDLAKISQWAERLRIPESILWFQPQHTASSTPPSNTVASNINSKVTDNEGDHVRRRELIKSIGIGATILGTSTLNDVAVSTSPNYRTIGLETVEIMREWTRTFRRVDNRFGGGHSLTQIGQYLSAEVMPKIQEARYNEKVRRELFSAASELYQLAGWMSYDIGNVEQGRKCLRQALRLAQDAGNQPFAAELLAGMSHQASFLRQADDAVDFALAAKEAARKGGIHALASEASVMAAHGFAQQGNKRACLSELQSAEAEFSRIRSGETPDWLTYFDEAYLSAKFGHALKDLGQGAQAERFAARSLQMNEGYDRGRMFNTALLASTLAQQGKIDEAVTYGRQAIQLAGNVRSQRTMTYLTEVAERLAPYQEEAQVQRLYKQMSASRVPLQRV